MVLGAWYLVPGLAVLKKIRKNFLLPDTRLTNLANERYENQSEIFTANWRF